MSAGIANEYPEGALFCLDGKLSSRTDVVVVRHTRN